MSRILQWTHRYLQRYAVLYTHGEAMPWTNMDESLQFLVLFLSRKFMMDLVHCRELIKPTKFKSNSMCLVVKVSGNDRQSEGQDGQEEEEGVEGR